MCCASFSNRVRLACRTMLRKIMTRASRGSFFCVVILLEVMQTKNNLRKNSLKESVRLIGISIFRKEKYACKDIANRKTRHDAANDRYERAVAKEGV